MGYLTKQQTIDIINKAPSNLNKEVLLKELGRSNTIEGYNEQPQKSNLLKDMGREIVKPFAQGAEVVSSGARAFGGVLKAGFQSATGNKEGAKQTLLSTAKQASNRPKLNVLGQTVPNIESGKDAVGAALNLASNFVGGAGTVKAGATALKTGLKTVIGQGMKTGGKAGFLYGVGNALQEDTNPLVGGLIGGATGGLAGGLIPAAGSAVIGTTKALVSPFSTAINKLTPTLDKIANKIETVITKPSKTDLAHGFKVENVFKYDLGGSLGTSLNKTQTLIDELVVKAENLRAGSKSTIDLNNIFSSVADEISNSKISTIGNNKKIFNAFKTWTKEIEEIAPTGRVNTIDGQKIKVALGKMGSWLNGQRDLDSNAMENVSNILYTKFKKAIENSVDDPKELQAINKQLSELIPINSVLIKRIPIADRNAAISLTDIISAGAGVVDPKAWGIFAINRLSKSGRFANLVSKGSKALKAGATKLLPLETKLKSSLKNIKPGLTIEDVSLKGKGVNLTTKLKSTTKPQKATGEVLKPKTSNAKEAIAKGMTEEQYVKGQGTLPSDRFTGTTGIPMKPTDKIFNGNELESTRSLGYMGDTVSKKVAQIKAGERPTVTVGMNGDQIVVVDGNHTLAAYKQLGIKDIPIIDKTNGALGAKTTSQLRAEYQAAKKLQKLK